MLRPGHTLREETVRGVEVRSVRFTIRRNPSDQSGGAMVASYEGKSETSDYAESHLLHQRAFLKPQIREVLSVGQSAAMPSVRRF